MRGVRRLALLRRALAGILHGERRHHDERLAQATRARRADENARQARIHRQTRHRLPDAGEAQHTLGAGTTATARRGPLSMVGRCLLGHFAPPRQIGIRTVRRTPHRAEFSQAPQRIPRDPGVRRIDEGEAFNVAEPQIQHPERDRRQVGALDLRRRVARPALEIRLRIEPETGARRDAAATPGALFGARLRDALHRQALNLRAVAVAGDARQAEVDHIAHVRHGDAGFRHVGGQYHAPAGARREDAALLLGRQAGVERQHLKAFPPSAPQPVRRIEDFPLPRQERQGVPRRAGGTPVDLGQAAVKGFELVGGFPFMDHVHRMAAPAH